jgi:uncharacterized membrane protein YfcA
MTEGDSMMSFGEEKDESIVSPIIVFSIAAFIGNFGVAVTGFGMAIIFLFVYTIADLFKLVECSRCGLIDAVFFQTLALGAAVPLLLFKSKSIIKDHWSKELIATFVPATIVGTPLGNFMQAHLPSDILRTIVGAVITCLICYELKKLESTKSFLCRLRGNLPSGDMSLKEDENNVEDKLGHCETQNDLKMNEEEDEHKNLKMNEEEDENTNSAPLHSNNSSPDATSLFPIKAFSTEYDALEMEKEEDIEKDHVSSQQDADSDTQPVHDPIEACSSNTPHLEETVYNVSIHCDVNKEEEDKSRCKSEQSYAEEGDISSGSLIVTANEIGNGSIPTGLSLRIWGFSLGFLSGFLGGLMGVRGPPLMVFFLMFSYPKNIVRANAVLILTVNVTIRITYYVVEDLTGNRDVPWFHSEYTMLYIWVVFSGLLGVPIGNYIATKMNQKQFKLVVAFMLLFSGLTNLIKGIINLASSK